MSKAAQGIERVIKANEGDLQPAMANLRQVARKLDEAIDPGPRRSRPASIGFRRRRPGSTPGWPRSTRSSRTWGPVNHRPVTDIGQAIRRINLIAADLELLTSKLRDGRGGLNTDGSLQKLITQAELHDNLNTMAISATQALAQLRTVLNALRTFADKVARDPSSLAQGASVPVSRTKAGDGDKRSKRVCTAPMGLTRCQSHRSV